jgi:uncharacterized protein YkwD
MPRVSPSSPWVVLPTVIATATLVTAVALAGAGKDGDDDPGRALAPAAAIDPAADPASPAPAAADRSTTASRDRRAQVAIPPAHRFQPAPPRRPAPRPTRSSTAPAPSTPSRPGTPPPPAPAPVTSAPAGNTSVAAQVVALTNAERAKAGCGPLSVDGTLTAVAQAHSQDMATHNYFDHNSQDGRSPFDRITAAGYSFSTAAENIAAGQRTPQDVMTSWMNSPGHKANILNCALHQIGVGYATASSSQYGVYWTQDFGTPR